MRDVKKILVPIDFSQKSARALQRAVSFATPKGLQLIALRVLEPSKIRDYLFSPFVAPEDPGCMSPGTVTVSLEVLLRQESLSLGNFVTQTVQGAARVRVKNMVRLGRLGEEIEAVSREEKVDLVIFELRKRFIFNSIAALRVFKMIRKLPCPVLLHPPAVPPTAEPKEAPRYRKKSHGIYIADRRRQIPSGVSRLCRWNNTGRA